MSRSPDRKSNDPRRNWPHHVAWVLTTLVVAMLFTGAMLAGRHAGTSPADWPLLPLGLVPVAVALTAWVWRGERPRWLRWSAVAMVGLLVALGALGVGLPTNEALMAGKIYGCMAPLLLALCAALVVATSRSWQAMGQLQRVPEPGRHAIRRLAMGVACGCYMALVIGVQLRYPGVGGAIAWFAWSVWLMIGVAVLLGVGVVGLMVLIGRRAPNIPPLVATTRLLALVLLVEVLLGEATWIVHYNWPGWFLEHVMAFHFTVVAQGWLQTTIGALHGVFGAVSLAVAVAVVFWSYRRA